jgi:predicted acylesterase/phospholipase RssA
VTKLGMYDSSKIQQWVDDELKQLLGRSKSVQFKDLIIPTTIVATDLKSKTVKLFSSATTPEEYVGEAVRYSCNIPVYFQPIQERFVDGGLISNLPTFVFKEKQDSLYERILAFTLHSAADEKPIDGIEDYFKLLTSTAIDGNVDLQVRLQKNIHVIAIPTGNIEATDFDKMDEGKVDFLIKNGREATQNFFTFTGTTSQKNKLCAIQIA